MRTGLIRDLRSDVFYACCGKLVKELSQNFFCGDMLPIGRLVLNLGAWVSSFFWLFLMFSSGSCVAASGCDLYFWIGVCKDENKSGLGELNELICRVVSWICIRSSILLLSVFCNLPSSAGCNRPNTNLLGICFGSSKLRLVCVWIYCLFLEGYT